jgi:hypothetical protein
MLCSWLTGSDDHAAQYIKSRPLARSPAEDSLDQCLKHYKSCLKHKKCKTAMKRDKHDTVPTRLLDIRPNLQARLCTVPQGKDTLYAALSYRWGSTQQQKDGRTMRANLQDRYGRIDISQLPQSIKDAVKVTQTLKLSYLWVDALCIIQDDPMDCASEMSKMASIYRGATVTISAASTKDNTEGFLGDRDLMKAYGDVFEFPYYSKRAGCERSVGTVFQLPNPVAIYSQDEGKERRWLPSPVVCVCAQSTCC